jgi:hypothetical protein
MFQTKVVEKIKIHILYSTNFFPPENRAIYELSRKIWCSQRGHRLQYNTTPAVCMLGKKSYTREHAPANETANPYIRKHRHAHRNTQYLLLLHCNNGFENATQCYVVIIITVICQTTGPQPLLKRFLHLMRSRASPFK